MTGRGRRTGRFLFWVMEKPWSSVTVSCVSEVTAAVWRNCDEREILGIWRQYCRLLQNVQFIFNSSADSNAVLFLLVHWCISGDCWENTHCSEPECNGRNASQENGRNKYLLLCCRPLNQTKAVSPRLNVKCSSPGHRVNDGLWHSVSLDTRNLQITLTVDNEPSSAIELWEQLESKGSFYFGGQWVLTACLQC